MRVSVLMATYNRGFEVNGVPLVERAILSFLNQDYANAELVILNDGSTDNTSAILKKFKYNNRIRIYEFDANKRPPNNWNWLWSMAQGDLICQLHDDDELTPDSLTLRVQEFLRDPSLQVVYGGVQTQNLCATDFHIYPGEVPDINRIWREEYINFTTLMYRADLPFHFDPDLRYYFDWLFKIRCLTECNTGYVQKSVMRYTVHHGQETNKCRRENMNGPDEKLMREKLNGIYGDSRNG